MSQLAAKKATRRKDIHTIIGLVITFFFGYVCPSFGGITPMGMKMIGVTIGLIYMTCMECDLMTSSIFAILAIIFHGYYTAEVMLTQWLGSTAFFQMIFCGAICVALSESGAMDVLAKKMLGAKICKGRPLMLVLMLFFAALIVSIFVNNAPFFILFFGLLDSILSLAGYKKDDPFVKYALLGLYVSSYGMMLLPWKAPLTITIALFNSVLEPYGFVFNQWLYILIELVTWVGLDIIYVLCLKFVFKADLSKLKDFDVNNLESMNNVPDKFDFHMKAAIGSLVFCILYIMVCNLLPVSDSEGYRIFVSMGMTFIWIVPLVFFGVIRKDGKPVFNLPVIAQKSCIWPMLALVGSLTMLGKICTDPELGIRGWLISLFTPIFGDMNIYLLLLVLVVFATLVTQVVNGQVVTMGLAPVVGALVCEMILNKGVSTNPTIVLTVVSACASVAYMFVSGSVNAAFLLGREEIDQKFIFTKGFLVLCIYMAWQYIVAVIANMLFAI